MAADPNVDVTGMAEAVEAALTGVAAPAWETYGQTVQGVQAGVLAPATATAASSVAAMAGSVGSSLAGANASVVNTGVMTSVGSQDDGFHVDGDPDTGSSLSADS